MVYKLENHKITEDSRKMKIKDGEVVCTTGNVLYAKKINWLCDGFIATLSIYNKIGLYKYDINLKNLKKRIAQEKSKGWEIFGMIMVEENGIPSLKPVAKMNRSGVFRPL